MTLRFQKADPAVDSHFKAEDPRVLVKPDEVPVKPVYPEDEAYWDEFIHTLERVTDAKSKSKANHVAECFYREGMTRADLCAKAVHKDWPSDLMQIAAKDAVANGEFRDLGLEGVFTDKVVLLDALIGLAGFYTSPSSFCYKDTMRVPRPEEVAGAIVRGEIEAPRRVELMLQKHPNYDELAEDQRKFTMFPEGSPPHGSTGAMHSAAASAEGFIIKLMVTGASSIVDLCTLNVGDFRNDAGVHTMQDNNIGFWIGQESAKRWVREFLINLGADPEKVDAAMLEAHTDWV